MSSPSQLLLAKLEKGVSADEKVNIMQTLKALSSSITRLKETADKAAKTARAAALSSSKAKTEVRGHAIHLQGHVLRSAGPEPCLPMQSTCTCV